MSPTHRIRVRVGAMVVAGLLCAGPLLAQDWFRHRSLGTPAVIGASSQTLDTVGIATSLFPVTKAFHSGVVLIDVPDFPNPGITSPVQVSGITQFSAIKLTVNVTHGFRGDLRVTLTSPGGTVVTVSDQEGGPADNIDLTDFVVNLPVGTPANGGWTLAVVDLESQDVGRLNYWSISFDIPNAATIDLTMSLESNPGGDDKGNVQGMPGSEQDQWERIVQHFADAVFEMTNGAHRIGVVRIFRKSTHLGAADIRWTAKGHPHATLSGVSVRGGHIAMFEVFEKGGEFGLDLPMLGDTAAEQKSGYAMAHEWGHYFLGLRDEYKSCFPFFDVVKVRPSIMNSPWNAVNPPDPPDYSWLNLSIARQSQGGGDFQDTIANCQHQQYGTGAWPVLARPPSEDPIPLTLGGVVSWLRGARRIYYPELTAAAPTGTSMPRIDLPNAAARDNLDIQWMAGSESMDLVIDKSGSMSGIMLEQAKAAATLLVDQATLGQTRIGVTAFSDTVTNLVSMTVVSTEAIRDQIKASIDAIVADGGTAIGDAAASALAKVQAARTPGDNTVVFLLSDGVSTTGRDPLSVIPDYVAAHVPLFTFGFGAGADTDVLSQLATQTGAPFFFSQIGLTQIAGAFQAANQLASSSPGVGTGSPPFLFLSGSSSSSVDVQVPFDASLGRVQVSIVTSGPVQFPQLISPSGQSIAAKSVSTAGSETLVYFDVEQPAQGNWRLRSTTNQGAVSRFSYSISGVHNGVGYDVNTGLRGGSLTVTAPGPVIIESRLTHRLPVAGATASATVTSPTSVMSTISLLDDGRYPDFLAGDGVYSAAFQPSGRGMYSATVLFSNQNRSARQTYTGADLLPVVGAGSPTRPADSPLTGDFSRSQTLQFSVATDATQAAPVVVAQPGSLARPVGSTIAFAVTAFGSPALSYLWQRRPAGGPSFQYLSEGGPYSGVTTAQLTVNVASAAMSGDQFRCVIVNAAGSITSEAATLTVSAPVFTDSVLEGAFIKAVHIQELRNHVSLVRAGAALPPFSWTDPTVSAGFRIRAIHIQELRTALSQAYAAVGRLPPTFTDSPILPGATVVRGAHLSELRSAVLALEP